MTPDSLTAPNGWEPYDRPSRYLDLIGPIYQLRDTPETVGLWIDERHTNARGFMHAGVLVAVADVVMGHTAQRAGPPGTQLVTASLTTDFPASAQQGDWIRGHATVRRVGRQMAFTSCEFSTADRLVLAASGVFAVPRTHAT